MTEKAKARLAKVAADQGKYRELLKQLLTQSLLRLLEPEVDVRVRKQDTSAVKEVFKDAAKLFQEHSGLTVKITLKEDYYLPDSW